MKQCILFYQFYQTMIVIVHLTVLKYMRLSLQFTQNKSGGEDSSRNRSSNTIIISITSGGGNS